MKIYETKPEAYNNTEVTHKNSPITLSTFGLLEDFPRQ